VFWIFIPTILSPGDACSTFVRATR
jgi:hypothetical protein